MNCESASKDLMECARNGGAPGEAVSAHLAGCPSCRERLDDERELASYLTAMRLAAVSSANDTHANDTQWNKAVLLREFDRNRRHERQVRWMWAMSSAAILVLSVVAVRDVWMRPVSTRAGYGNSPVAAAAQTYPLREYPQESFGPAEEAGEKGFIKVPFALPPAPGETFGIVRKELEPAELARMGVSVDPGWTGTLQADVLVGEDGLAQAVRLSHDENGEN